MLKPTAKYLGYAGLIPFVSLPFLIAVDALSFLEGLLVFNQYSALILSFLGGTIWLDSQQSQKPNSQLYYSMLPTILGWFALAFLPYAYSVGVLAACFVALLIYEIKALNWPAPYLAMRVRLTTIVVGTHMMMLWLVYTIGR